MTARPHEFPARSTCHRRIGTPPIGKGDRRARRTPIVARAGLVGLVLALCVLAPAAAFAQDGNENDGQRAELYGSWDWNDTIWHIIPLYGDRAACVQGLGFFVRAEFWSMFGEPVVLSGASYNWSQQDLQVAIFRDVGPIEAFDCGDGDQIASVELAPTWGVRTERNGFVSFEAPFEAMTEAISVYGFEFSMNVTPNRPLALPKVWYNEDFSGVFRSGGSSSFNVAGSPSWGELFHRYGEIHIAEFRQAQALPANEARSRLAALLQECPENDACGTRVMVKSVIKGNVYGLVHELTRRSDTFRDLYYDSPKEALVEELMAGVARERPGSSRHARRTQLVDKALAGFEGDIDPDLADRWADIQEHETRRNDARELDRLDERLTDAIADEGEADDDLRAEVRRAADGVQGDWGEGRAQLLREWAAYESPEQDAEGGSESEAGRGRMVGAGTYHSCGLTGDGVAYCWGNGSDHRLGTSSTFNESSPVAVETDLRFRELSVGGHTCGLTEEGKAYCWGVGSDGALGDGSTTDRSRPTPVAGGHTFAQISVGGRYTCGVTRQGRAYCWGWNSSGALWGGSNTDPSRPEAVRGGRRFTQLSALSTHICGVARNGQIYCWGSGHYGQLGDGSTSRQDRPVRVASDRTFEQVVVGSQHTCALADGGDAYCWGWNRYGQLGDGSTTNRNRPVAVSGGHAFVQLSVGASHSCGLTQNGRAYCWGHGSSGKLGNGSTSDQSRPVRVAGDHAFTQISTSGDHTCALTRDGAAYCWGDGDDDRLGTYSSSWEDEPVRVREPF